MIAVAGVAAMTLILLVFRDDITPLSEAFAFLAVVVVAAAVGGLAPGIAASVVSFIAFNYFFIPPYGSLTIARPEHVVVLFVFLGLSVLISELLARATERAYTAEMRGAELHAIQELGRELTTRLPGPETYEAALTTVKDAFGYTAVALYVEQTEETRGLVEQVTVGMPARSLPATWDPRSPDPAPERLPLSVGGRMLGLVVLKGDRPPLTPAESRVLRAFCDQLALVLERDRLLRSATQAEVYRQTEGVRRSLLAAVSHDLRSPLAAIKASVTDLLDEAPGHQSRPPPRGSEGDRLRDGQVERADRQPAGHVEDRVGRTTGASARRRSLRGDRGHGGPEPSSATRRGDFRPGLARRRLGTGRSGLPRSCTEQPLGERGQRLQRTGPSSVEVDARLMDGDVVVRVIDHGVGVPVAAREQLFYPFYRMDDRNPRLGPGLGLAICKGFVDLLERRDLDRRHARRWRYAILHASSGRSRCAQLKKERILVVDDEAQIRQALFRALVARGYEVEVAVDGEEGLAIASAFQPDVVVLDLNLPGIDGFDVCRGLRTWTSAPILVLSVREDEVDKVEALDLGADDYLTKPFGIDEFLARVRALLRRSEVPGNDTAIQVLRPRPGDRSGPTTDLSRRRRRASHEDGVVAARGVRGSSRQVAHP